MNAFFRHYCLIQVPGVDWKYPQNVKSEVKEMNNSYKVMCMKMNCYLSEIVSHA